jgi:hypothetical protein
MPVLYTLRVFLGTLCSLRAFNRKGRDEIAEDAEKSRDVGTEKSASSKGLAGFSQLKELRRLSLCSIFLKNGGEKRGLDAEPCLFS